MRRERERRRVRCCYLCSENEHVYVGVGSDRACEPLADIFGGWSVPHVPRTDEDADWLHLWARLLKSRTHMHIHI